MADPNQVVAAEPAGAESVYRPVSGLAIAGFTVGCLYFGVVLITIVVALIQRGGFFLHDAFLLMPIGGAVLCFLAQRQIRASEGTRAGLGLARWGLWLSVFTGLGYFAYYQFTGWAVKQQANAFLVEKDSDSGFFPLLQEGGSVQVNAAFLLTQPEGSRGNVRPENMKQMARLFDTAGRQGPGALTSFREHFLIRVLGRAGKDCKIEPQGFNDWGYEKGGYFVTRFYKITTPEVIIVAKVPVRSTEGDTGGMRKWFVLITQFDLVNVDYTPLGQSLENVNKLAKVFVENIWAGLRQGKASEAIPDKTDWAKVTGGQGPWQEMRGQIKDILAGKQPKMMFQPAREQFLNPWRIEKGKLQLDFPGSLQFPGPGQRPIVAECKITVECNEVVVPPGQEQPDPALFPAQPHWRIASFEVLRLAAMSAK